ncbi:MAG TPA: hypothetical protein VFZ89_12830 [Solirubrobacteraceae bacterium]
MIKRTTLITLLVAMFATAAPASAQTGNAYGGEGNVLGEVTQGTAGVQSPAGNSQGEAGEPREGGEPATASHAAGPGGATAATSGSSLPFTGFDVLLLIAGGLMLIGVGAGVRRLTATAYE